MTNHQPLTPKLQRFISFLHSINGHTVQSVFVLSDTMQSNVFDTSEFYSPDITVSRNSNVWVWSFQAKVNDCNNATSVITFTVLEKEGYIRIELDSDDNPVECLEPTPRATAKVLTMLRIYVREFLSHRLKD